MVLACNPKYAPKPTAEEKARHDAVKAALRPGCVLELVLTDYHEDLETPPGFHVTGDRLELVRVTDDKKIPITRKRADGTWEKVGEIDIWLCKSSRWGEKKCDAHYLAWMTKVVEP